MAIHIMNALEEGNSTFLVRSVDSDVVIILLGRLDEIMTRYPDCDIWIRFGKGNALTNISLSSVLNHIDKEMARGLPFFHAFTGCDTTSAFKGKAKKTAWHTWKAYQAMTAVFDELSQSPFTQISENSTTFCNLEKFVVRMYSRSVDTTSVNEARKLLFAQCSTNMERIPPTRDALLQHTKHAIYQTGNFSIFWLIITSPATYIKLHERAL